MLLLLSATTGLVDAASVLGLGKVFTANMTGNLVLAGLFQRLNAVIVGLELTALFADGAAFLPTFAINALWVAVGEVVCAVVLGLLLYKAVGSNRTLTSLLA